MLLGVGDWPMKFLDYEEEYLDSISPLLEKSSLGSLFDRIYNEQNRDLAVRVILALAILRNDYSNFRLAYNKDNGNVALGFIPFLGGQMATVILVSDRLTLGPFEFDKSGFLEDSFIMKLFKKFEKTYREGMKDGFIDENEKNHLVLQIVKTFVMDLYTSAGSRAKYIIPRSI